MLSFWRECERAGPDPYRLRLGRFFQAQTLRPNTLQVSTSKVLTPFSWKLEYHLSQHRLTGEWPDSFGSPDDFETYVRVAGCCATCTAPSIPLAIRSISCSHPTAMRLPPNTSF